MTEEPFECETPGGGGMTVQVVVTATTISSVDTSKPVGAVTMTSLAQLFPMRLAGEDAEGRQLQEDSDGAASASQAGASVSFSLYQARLQLTLALSPPLPRSPTASPIPPSLPY